MIIIACIRMDCPFLFFYFDRMCTLIIMCTDECYRWVCKRTRKREVTMKIKECDFLLAMINGLSDSMAQTTYYDNFLWDQAHFVIWCEHTHTNKRRQRVSNFINFNLHNNIFSHSVICYLYCVWQLFSSFSSLSLSLSFSLSIFIMFLLKQENNRSNIWQENGQQQDDIRSVVMMMVKLLKCLPSLFVS